MEPTFNKESVTAHQVNMQATYVTDGAVLCSQFAVLAFAFL